MQSLISVEQAKKITGGRTPLIPVVYEDAIKALSACLSIDEAKIWSDKADALAAWAKIYRDDKVGRQAKALKLHAYRRMGQIAGEIRPPLQGAPGVYGRPKGPQSLLVEQGLGRTHASAARHLSKMSDQNFKKLTSLPNPPSPMTVSGNFSPSHTEMWKDVRSGLGRVLSFVRKYPPRAARELTATEAIAIRRIIVEIGEWIDEFEQHLPK